MFLEYTIKTDNCNPNIVSQLCCKFYVCDVRSWRTKIPVTLKKFTASITINGPQKDSLVQLNCLKIFENTVLFFIFFFQRTGNYLVYYKYAQNNLQYGSASSVICAAEHNLKDTTHKHQ